MEMRPYCAGAFLFYGHESSSSCSFYYTSLTYFYMILITNKQPKRADHYWFINMESAL